MPILSFPLFSKHYFALRPYTKLQAFRITIPQFMKYTNYKFLWFAREKHTHTQWNLRRNSCLVSVWSDTARLPFVPAMLAVFSWPNERDFDTHLHVVFVLWIFICIYFSSLYVALLLFTEDNKIHHKHRTQVSVKWWMFEEEWIATKRNQQQPSRIN